MRFLDRFTRDEVSAKIWWPLALLCIVALVASVPLANRAADNAREDASLRAAESSNASIEPLTSAGATATDLAPVLEQLAASDPVVTAVRVWDAQHALFASSVPTDALGSAEALNDADIDAAIKDGRTWVLSDRLPTGDAGPVTYYAYTVIHGSGGSSVVTQFEAPDATLLTDVHQFWLAFRIAVGVAALLILALAGLSMREPVARIGTGVPFYPESVPPWLAVIDVDRAVALEQAGGRAKDRLIGLQQRLDESERQRLKAEGELQQALAAVSAGGRGMPVPSAPASTSAGAPRQPTPEAAAAAVAAAAASAKAAKARRTKKAVPAAAADATEPATAEPVVVPEPEPAVPKPPVAVEATPEPAPEPVGVTADDVTVSSVPVETERDGNGWPEVVVLPDPEPARHAAVAAGSPDSDADVLDVLNRLVEPVGDPEPAGDDAGDMRARLARTAALKKPGSRERREERERGEHERSDPWRSDP